MTLTGETQEFASWFWQATRRIVDIDRRAAWRLILSMSLNQFVTVLVFFLPLKVVLLIASEGVPRYFKFFVSEDTRMWWLGGLAGAIFILYFVTIGLEKIADRSATQGARNLTSSAEQVPVTSDPEDFARQTFYRIGETAGGLIFSLISLGLGIIVFPELFLAVPLLLTIEFALAAVAINKEGTDRLSRLGDWVRNQPQDLFQYLRQVNFLIVFALLLALFLLIDGLNPLLAIAAIMLSRRLFGTMRSLGRNSLKLSKDRELVDTLLFEDIRLKEDGGAERKELMINALPSARLKRFHNLAQAEVVDATAEMYTDDLTIGGVLESIDEAVWIDSGRMRMAVFDLYGPTRERAGSTRVFRDYLYTEKAARGLEQQDYLFNYLGAEDLRCPRRILSYRYNGLVGRLVDFRGISDPPLGQWQARRQELLEHLWALEVPSSLVTAYNSAHRRLEDRARSDLPEALQVATDEDWAQSAYDLVISRLPEICQRVAELPIMILNERLSRRNVVADWAGRSLFLDWTLWSMQPVGAGLFPKSDSYELFVKAGETAGMRKGVEKNALVSDVVLAAFLQRLDRSVQDGYPKTGLSTASTMLPFIEQPDGTVLDEMFRTKFDETIG
jgi:hypothetical protein